MMAINRELFCGPLEAEEQDRAHWSGTCKRVFC